MRSGHGSYAVSALAVMSVTAFNPRGAQIGILLAGMLVPQEESKDSTPFPEPNESEWFPVLSIAFIAPP